MTEPVHIISLGAGVQSSTMALMAAAGEITPMPIAAIFADTQAEPAAVYEWLDWLEAQLPFPVYRVTAGDLGASVVKMHRSAKGKLYSTTDIPGFTRSADGRIGMVSHRNCTRNFKIRPIMKKMREIAGIARGQKSVGVVQWIGISLDEVTRMKPSRDPWAVNRWPLIDARMRRSDCLLWADAHGVPRPPRSACVFCPYRSNEEWRALPPPEFAVAVKLEADWQSARTAEGDSSSIPYLHPSCIPLPMVDFSTAEERGQINLFENECEGMCGV